MALKHIGRRAANRIGCGCLIFWVLLFIVVVAFFMFQSTQLFSNYHRFQVDTKTSVKSPDELEFPAVTLCAVVPILSGANAEDQSSQTAEQQFDIYYGYNLHDKYMRGLKIEDLLHSCQFNGGECDDKDFSHHFDPALGNCYTFNAGFKRNVSIQNKNGNYLNRETAIVPVFKTHRYGPDGGIIIELWEPSNLKGRQRGIYLQIHSSNHLPSSHTEGMTLQWKSSVKVRLEARETKHLSHPYHSCNANTTADVDVQKEWPSAHYSRSTCLERCNQKHLVAKCDCQSSRQFYVSNKIMSCTNNSTTKECSAKVNSMNGCKEECPEECNKLIYKQNVIVQPFIKKDTERILIKIYYGSMDVETLEQYAMFTAASLFGQFGITFVLWIGTYVLALVTYLVCCRKCVEPDDSDD